MKTSTARYSQCFDHGLKTWPCVRVEKKNLLAAVVLTPRAKHAGVIGLHGGYIKVAVTVPPVDGKANAALLEVMAEWLKLPKSRLALVKGSQSRRKTVAILSGVEGFKFVADKLAAALQNLTSSP